MWPWLSVFSLCGWGRHREGVGKEALDPVEHHNRAKREQLKRLEGLLPDSQGRNLALALLFVPYSLDSG